MAGKQDLEKLIADLAAGRIVPLTVARWNGFAPAFKLVSEVPTSLGGTMLLVRRPLPDAARQGWALVEDPKPGQRVIRPLANEKEARALIAERLAAYERMWDG
jgi:hypothetical protein